MTDIKFHPDVIAAHAQFGGDMVSMQKCYDWYDLQTIVDRHTKALARVPETVSAALKAHCGQEGGLPRINWYDLRNELILAVATNFADSPETRAPTRRERRQITDAKSGEGVWVSEPRATA